MNNIPEPYELFEQYDGEMERIHKMHKRNAENHKIVERLKEPVQELPFTDVPMDNGKYTELYQEVN